MSTQTCLEVVKRNRFKIRVYIEEFLDSKQLTPVTIFVFKSRVTGTCKPYSDIDIYVQLAEKHRSLIEKEGGLWADKKVLHKGVYDIPSPAIEVIQEGEYKGREITLDITLGVDPVPPLPLKYKGQKSFVELNDVTDNRMIRRTMDVVKEQFGTKDIVGAEVGVSKGFHALNMLENMPNIKLLYLVDPYLEGSIWEVYKEGAKKKILEATMRLAKQRMSSFNTKVQWVHKQFEECTAEDIPDPLDFIYIDGNHAYEHVSKDIALAAQLVKKGGVVGGHDAGAAGVTKAYKEYCGKKTIKYFVAENKSPHPWQGSDWWFING